MNNSGTIFLLTSVFLISLFLSWYAFQAVRTITSNWEGSIVRSVVHGLYWLISAIYIIYVTATILTIIQEGKITVRSQMGLNTMLTVTITQITVILFLVGEDLYRGLQGSVNFMMNNVSEDKTYIPGRRKFVSQI